MLESHYLARPFPGGFTWTLASRLGQMLHDLEGRFGPRDPSYTILGIEFKAGGPQLWFPGNRRHMVIQLGADCQDDDARALFQLSHEAVHLLNPRAQPAASVLEEGLATWYSQDYTRRVFGTPFAIGDHKYEAAERLVRPIAEETPATIRTLRSTYGGLTGPRADQVAECITTIGQSKCVELTTLFSTWAHGA